MGVTNFARFYGVFNKILFKGDREDLKRDLVRQVTGGRTESLREVTRREYEDLCSLLERSFPEACIQSAILAEIKRHRSICLRLMQKIGIDTTDWTRINAFCRDGRIAGKVFRDLSLDDLDVLARKLRSIERKGGIRSFEEPCEKATIINIIHQ